MPATAGPTRRAPLTIDEFSAIALTRSSAPTISTMNDWRAGISNALTTPSSEASTKTCQIWMARSIVSAARIAASTIAPSAWRAARDGGHGIGHDAAERRHAETRESGLRIRRDRAAQSSR